MILFDAIGPIVLIVIFGWLMGRFKIVNTDLSGPLMQYVFFAAAPFVVFYALITNPISKLLYWRFWIAYPLSLLIMIAITYVIFRFVLRREHFNSIIAGFASAMANTVIIGYPVLSGFVGHFAAIPMSITIICFALVFIPVLIFIFEIKSAQSESAEFKKTIKMAVFSTLKNPIVIGVIVGIIFQLFSIDTPKFIKTFASYMGESIVPVALFCVGLDLTKFKLKGNFWDISLVTILNLVLTPVIAILLAKWLDLSPIYSVALVIFSSVPTAKTLYVIAGKYQLYSREVAAIVSSTTLLAVITIPFYTYICTLIWPSVFHG